MIRLLARVLLGGMALVGLGTFVGLAIQRVPYPLELDCIEGVMMDHVTRLAHGQPIFVEPSLEFIPLAYMPGFAALSSLVTRAAGDPGLWQPRTVSFVASLLLMLLIAVIVHRETRRPLFGLAAAGLFAMGFGVAGGSYDLARPDSLMLLLAFTGLATLRRTRGPAGAAAAAMIMSLAFFTKQHAALLILGAAAHLAFQDRRRLPVFALAALAGCGGGYLLLTAWLGEWFRVFTWSIPRGWSEVDRGRILYYFADGLFGAAAPLSVALLLSLAFRPWTWAGQRGLWGWTALAAVGTGLMATLDANAYRHLFMPTLLACCVAAPIAVHALIGRLQQGEPGLLDAEVVGMLLLAVAHLPLFYPAHLQLPHPRAMEAHYELLARMRTMPGQVLMPYHGWYAQNSGHATSLQIIALDDIERSRGNELLRRDPEFLARMFAPLREGPGRPWIITDRPLRESGDLWAAIEPGYRLVDSLGWMHQALKPVTGNQYAPNLIYEPWDDRAETLQAATDPPAPAFANHP